MEGPLTRALCANLGEPHRLRVAAMTTLAFWSEIPSSLFLRPFSAGTILSGKQSKLLLHIIPFTSVLMCSHCSNWDCCQFMDPWSNRIRRFPIGGLVFCSNLRLTGKLTKITPLMTDNQCLIKNWLDGIEQYPAYMPGILSFISSFQKHSSPVDNPW